MPEIPKAMIDKCEGCGAKGIRSTDSRVGLGRTLVLDDNKRCVECAPPARCHEGAPCEFGRVVAWRHEDRAVLKKLRLCDAHDKARTSLLRAAKKRDAAALKRAVPNA